MESQISTFNIDLNNLSTTVIPAITTTIKTQRSLTSQLTTDHTNLQQQQNEHQIETQHRFENQQTNINELYELINTLQNTHSNLSQTPNSRPRKKAHSQYEQNTAFGTQESQTQPSTDVNTSMEEALQETSPPTM
jgi:hypothetical protein